MFITIYKYNNHLFYLLKRLKLHNKMTIERYRAQHSFGKSA